MVVDGFRVFTGSMRTGRVTADIPVSGNGWGVRLNTEGSITATVRARSTEARRIDLRAATTPRQQFVAVAYGDRILEAGPIWKRPYAAGKGTLQIGAAGIWSLLEKRKAFNWSQLLAGVPVTQTSINLSGLTLGAIARELVRISIEDNPDGDLPIVLPDIIDAGTNERNYPGYELPWLGTLLRNLTKAQDGPDIRFQPRYKDGDLQQVEWVMEYGTPAAPLLTQHGDDWIFDGTTEKSGVVDFSINEDADALADTVFVPGSGQERDMRLGVASSRVLLDQGHPYTDADIASKDVEDQGILDGYADRLLADSSAAWNTWSIVARADQAPLLGTYRPGDWARAVVPRDHPQIDGGEYRVRIMAIDGDTTDQVKLTVAPLQSGLSSEAYGISSTTVTSDHVYLYPAPDLYPGPATYPL